MGVGRVKTAKKLGFKKLFHVNPNISFISLHICTYICTNRGKMYVKYPFNPV